LQLSRGRASGVGVYRSMYALCVLA
jgi:hypothetical protein